MAVAMVKSLDSNDFKYGDRTDLSQELNINRSLVVQAFIVMEYAPDLAPEVMAKTKRRGGRAW